MCTIAYDLRDITRETGIDKQDLLELIGTGRLPCRDIGGRRIVLADDLLFYLRTIPPIAPWMNAPAPPQEPPRRGRPPSTPPPQPPQEPPQRGQTIPPASPAPEAQCYTVAQALKIMGIGRSKLYQIISEGSLPAFKIGKRRLIRHIEMMAYIKRHGG